MFVFEYKDGEKRQATEQAIINKLGYILQTGDNDLRAIYEIDEHGYTTKTYYYNYNND